MPFPSTSTVLAAEKQASISGGGTGEGDAVGVTGATVGVTGAGVTVIGDLDGTEDGAADGTGDGAADGTEDGAADSHELAERHEEAPPPLKAQEASQP